MPIFAPFSFLEQKEPAAPAATHRIRTDTYASFVYYAMPGTYFTNGEDFTMTDAWSDISGDINNGVSSKGSTNFTGGSTAPGSTYVSSSTNFSSEGYTESLVTQDVAGAAKVSPSDLPFGSDNFVVECWVMPDETFGRPPFHKPIIRSSTAPYEIEGDYFTNTTLSTTAHRFRGYVNDTSYTSANSAGSYAANTWQHFAFVRSGSTFRFFEDGVQKYSFTDASSINSTDDIILFGDESFDNQNENARWAMQDLRISIGTDRGYSGGFTPPSSIIEKIV